MTGAKRFIASTVSPDLLARLKRMAKQKKMPYQTLLHVLLENAAFRG